MKRFSVLSAVLALLIMTASRQLQAQPAPTRAVAAVSATDPKSTLIGTVQFTESQNGLLVEANLLNVPPGKHGFHIHEKGSCADAGKAAGGHFNPSGAPHGHLMHDGHRKAHAGDMGNIEINENGTGSLSTTLPEVGLKNGKYKVAGLSVILHEKADDFGQPTGNAGGRIGCGIIEVQESK